MTEPGHIERLCRDLTRRVEEAKLVRAILDAWMRHDLNAEQAVVAIYKAAYVGTDGLVDDRGDLELEHVRALWREVTQPKPNKETHDD